MMLFLHLAIIFLMREPSWGQSFTPVPYNFPDIPESNTSGYTNYLYGNANQSINFVCAASNGFGTWAGDNAGNWYLLSNSLQTETTNLNAPVPSGIVTSGKFIKQTIGAGDRFTISSQLKVTANCKGNVRFVWLNSTMYNGMQFIIQGFDPGTTGVDISIPQSYPNGSQISGINSAFEIVKGNEDPNSETTKKIKLFPAYTVVHIPSFTTDRIDGPGLADDHWADNYAIACDANFLYIVWQENINNGNSSSNQLPIFVVALNLSNGLPAAGYENGPVIINSSQDANGYSIQNAVRPSVGCDLRNAPVTPDFDVAYIPASNNGNVPILSGQVLHVHITDAHLPNLRGSTLPVNRAFEYNSDLNAATRYLAYNSPRRVRMLVASVRGNNTPCRGIYVINDATNRNNNDPAMTDAEDLILHKFIDGTENNPACNAKYVDGNLCQGKTLVDSHTPSLFLPENTHKTYHILNMPIEAFTNPYDGQASNDFDEFHCIYQIIAIQPTSDGRSPLMIARGWDNGRVLVGNTTTVTKDTRTLVNRQQIDGVWSFLDDPNINSNSSIYPNYTGSVNQMGINIYWRGADIGVPIFHSRDKRAFDEPIEENTLLTADCFVDDGSLHGGTNGATLLGGRTMTFWSDPHFGNTAVANVIQGTLYARNANNSSDSWNNAQLWFGYQSADAKLFIGDNTLTSTGNPGATLNITPNYEIHFNGVNPSNNAITINPASTLSFYGTPYQYVVGTDDPTPPFQNIFNKGSINLLGGVPDMTNTTQGNHPSLLHSPAVLNIHGGSEFQIANHVTLNATNSQINFLFEPSILPLRSDGNANTPTCGFIDLYGTGVFNSCIITNSSGSTGKVLRGIVCKSLVLPPEYLFDPYAAVPATQLSLTNCFIQGINSVRFEISCNSDVSNANSPSTLATRAKSVFADDVDTHTQPLSPSDVNQRNFAVDGGLFTHSTFFVANPWNPTYDSPYYIGGTNTVSITNASFTGNVYLFRNNTLDYHNILIDQNNFTGTCRIEGFNQQLEWTWSDDAQYQHVVNRINVTNNTIAFTNIGIYSINSNIAVGNNTLTSTTGGAGILQTQNNEPGLAKNTSFFCNNTIHGGAIGMQLDNWSDYIKLSNIGPDPNVSNSTGPDIGIKLMDNINGFLDYSGIRKCNMQGLLLQPGTPSNLAKLDAQGTYNVFELNNVTAAGAGSSETGQIDINDGGRLKIRSHNNIIRRAGLTPNDNFILGSPTVTIGYGAPGEDVMDGNYWADNSASSAAPFTKYTPATPTHDANFSGINYTDATSDLTKNDYYTTTDVFCSSGIPNQTTHKNNINLLSVPNDTSCFNIIHQGDALRQAGSDQDAYDKYRTFFDSCAYLSNSWEFFSEVGATNADRNSDVNRFEEYRDWLKKVLYYSLDSNYYCADVNEIMTTFTWFSDIRGRDIRGALAVDSFLVKSGKCPKSTIYIDTGNIPAGWRALYQSWLDSVQHPTLTPFDSTLPSLEDLGLGILRGKPADVKKFIDAARGEILTNIIALENPFSSDTKIDFTCREATAIHFEVFDILGKKWFEVVNKIYEEGANQIVLPGRALPHGELFGRFSSSDGTVKTIKLQHIE